MTHTTWNTFPCPHCPSQPNSPAFNAQGWRCSSTLLLPALAAHNLLCLLYICHQLNRMSLYFLSHFTGPLQSSSWNSSWWLQQHPASHIVFIHPYWVLLYNYSHQSYPAITLNGTSSAISTSGIPFSSYNLQCFRWHPCPQRPPSDQAYPLFHVSRNLHVLIFLLSHPTVWYPALHSLTHIHLQLPRSSFPPSYPSDKTPKLAKSKALPSLYLNSNMAEDKPTTLTLLNLNLWLYWFFLKRSSWCL